MENDDAKTDQKSAPSDIGRVNTRRERRKQTNESARAEKKARNHKKWSLWRHWKAASRPKQAKWILEGIGAMAAVGVIGVYVWSNLQTKWNFETEHKPKVVHSKPPEFLQAFTCDPSAKKANTGNMNLFFKNIGHAAARHVTWERIELMVIPEQKTGDHFIDDPPAITEATCQEARDDGKWTSIDEGMTLVAQMRQSFVTLPSIPPGAIVQFHMSSCVYYMDDQGGHHGTCNGYRLFVPSTLNVDSILGTPSIVCDGKEVSGKWMQTMNSCEN